MIVSEAYFLEHFGTPGMKWGVRKNQAERKARAEQFKRTRKANAKRYERRVEKARANVKSGEPKAAMLRAKADYHVNKEVMGRKAARRVLYKARKKPYNEIQLSKQAKNGKEMAGQVLLAAGAYVLADVAARQIVKRLI